jgi:hypothetical protein
MRIEKTPKMAINTPPESISRCTGIDSQRKRLRIQYTPPSYFWQKLVHDSQIPANKILDAFWQVLIITARYIAAVTGFS